MCVHIVSNANIDKFLIEKPLAVLHFWAVWQPAVFYVGERVCKVSKLFLNVNFGMLNVDEERNWGIASSFQIKSLPTVVYCKGKDFRVMDTGIVTTNRMVNRVRSLLG